ncbi:MAG: hypothetical protein OEV94_10355 [Deltaproteobacteria bacterium]|nr:hypothetical protein [Deltaproteobacteria bacterium]
MNCRQTNLAWKGLVWLAAAAGLGGCLLAPQAKSPVPMGACAPLALYQASVLYEDAKVQMAKYYKMRADENLLNAYYWSEDAMNLSLSAKSCPDYDADSAKQAKDLYFTARMLRGLAHMNMRDTDPWVTTGLYGQGYREIFKNDIH